MLHEIHVGIVRMKLFARSCIWSPFIDSNIEKLVVSCSVCQKTQNKTKYCPNFILFIYFSKWIHMLPKNSNCYCYREIKINFFYFDLCNTFVSDNGWQFRSDVFELFLKCNGISQMFSPAINILAMGWQKDEFILLNRV